MDRRVKGTLSELLVLTRLVREGYSIAIPFGNQKGWDCLVETPSGWDKYQVKTAYRRSDRPSISVDCIRSGDPKSKDRGRDRGYSEGELDFLIAVDLDSCMMWKLPSEKVVGRRSRVLTTEFIW